VTRIVVDREETAGQIHRLLRVWYPSAAAAADETAHAAVRSATAALDTPRGELAMRTEPAATDGDEPKAEVKGAPGAGARGDDAPVQEVAAPAAAAEEPDEPAETAAERLVRLERLARHMPEVELHTDDVPLFHRFGVETQLEDAFRRTIRLPAGGSIVIDQTEALVAVDVNSGRLTGESDPETTALVTNLEAVQEAARQLRLRDLGGLVVIDFIDMRDRSSRRQVEVALRDALSGDRARIRMGHMGPFGLVVLSRQRIRQALTRITHEPCAPCGGTGRRRQLSGLGLRVLREIEARVARSRGRGGLEVRAPQDVVAWLRKNRISVIRRLRTSCSGPIKLEADARLASDGWAMKGLPPTGPDGEEE
jgi:Ribonuclease G/E